MANISDKLGIRLEIGHHTMSVNIPRDMEEIYRAAGKLINQKINTYSVMYPQKDYEQVLSMVLVDISLSYKLSENENNTAPYLQSIDQLTKEIEETLNNK